MKSLRGSLLVRTITACVVCFAIAGAVLFYSLRISLLNHFDATLAARAESVMAGTEESDAGAHIESDALPIEFWRPHDFFQAWTENGKAIARSNSLQQAQLPRELGSRFAFITLPDGRAGRAMMLTFVPRRDDDESRSRHAPRRAVTLVVAKDARDLHREIAQTMILVGTVFAMVTLVASIVMSGAVSAGLRPVAALAEHINAARERGLPGRVELHDAPAELMPVVARLNELLKGMESAFAREKAFTADVAHELRTPISGLESALEVCSARERSSVEYRQVIDRCRTTVQQMHRLIEQLLLLARADSGQVVKHVQWIALDEFLRECWEGVEARASARQLEVHWNIPAAVQVHSDRGLLGVVVNNILDNAVSYAGAGGAIELNWDEPRRALVISNTGCALANSDIPSVFERFWRNDTSRTATGRHAGLGLSLCRKIMFILGGQASAQIRAGGVFEISLAFAGMARSKAGLGKNQFVGT